uniref:Uncharacterized protein n=1 Tax=Thermogemmatispora argillosa TaxID=2045280 RepID=A0A455SZ46_9CHLR|nr:hypothetical protein KTA_03610 [Thermogemmatispora argillosa]
MQQITQLLLTSATVQPTPSYEGGKEEAQGTLWQTTQPSGWSRLKRLAALLIIMHPRLLPLMSDHDTRRLIQLLTSRDRGAVLLD